jgi:hypothetical protein
MTVFLDAQQLLSVSWNQNAFDEITLSEIGGGDCTDSKSLPQNSEASVWGTICTAGSTQMGSQGFFYVEDPDRTSGIRVSSSTVVREGDLLNVVGTIGLLSTRERHIYNPSVLTIVSSSNPVPSPIGLGCRALGGTDLNKYTPGVAGGVGLNNLGLLVRIAGKVSSPGSGFFYVDDGSGVSDGTGYGVKVLYSGTNPPTVGKMVSVTGISSVEYRNSLYRPVLRTRKDSDITKVD